MSFETAFEKMILNEGGYRLTNIAGDRGGQTYAGIARNFWPKWAGWSYIDSGDMGNLQLSYLVREFYKREFWDKVQGDNLQEHIAESIFDFSVNAGVSTGVKLAQLVVSTVPDGRMGPVTVEKLNSIPPAEFILKYALAKIARYAQIVDRDRTQSKFLLGWIRRALQGAA
jgi:lysozyme family protein